QGLGGVGIEFIFGSALHVQSCVIRNFEGGGSLIANGIFFAPQADNQQLFVSDTIIFNNGSGTARSAAITIIPLSAAGSAKVVLDRVRLENNVDGLLIDSRNATGGGGLRVIVRDSAISGNAANGIRAVTSPG